jgi:hypothetical protein
MRTSVWYEMAVARVDGDPKLRPYRDLLVEYDWPEGEQHYEWVATASTATLIKWAKGIREDEDAERNANP